MPPPKGVGVVAVECNGYNANRGTGWVSLSNSEAAKPHVVEFEPNRTGLHVVEVSEQTSKIKKISGQRASERASEQASEQASKQQKMKQTPTSLTLPPLPMHQPSNE